MIIIILESVCWKGLNLDTTDDTPAPVLRRLAAEGVAAKCYVSLPHSSKAQFTILTGTHPCSGVEIREAMRERSASVIWSLRAHKGASTVCFSVQYLPFENTAGMLGACGIRTLFGPDQLSKSPAPQSAAQSSFGADDALLLRLPPQWMSEAGKPFAAVFITMAAHYPYNWPGKTASRLASTAPTFTTIRCTKRR